MSLVDLSLLLTSTLSFCISARPPNPPPETSEQVKVPLSDSVLVKGSVLLPIMTLLPCLAATAVSLALNFPSRTSGQILAVLLPAGHLHDLTPSRYLIAGSILAVAGGLGRIWCYRTLGRHFTFELSLRKEHRLVTDGPYSVVRHPSYTAIVLVVVGLTLVHLSPGSFSRSCGWLDTTWGKTIFGAWATQCALTISVLFSRTKREDVMLKEHFGEVWEKYARRVRYRLVPGVY
ncbi:hypothetical protein BV22DRAFT_1103312 [Leucogyrophana mollusca]|uniref:Uncharacterized protein n=1 Tax=Leucogyrophana mollusca TaxID=85980 RepID=A0ACB8BPY6_9AGAM|nr:hypothetical protein BV22DRAFT_1103312 [Leucogyrophana mollusca]